MRPVKKWNWPSDLPGVKKVYSPYRIAINDLGTNLGDYCSYCGMQVYIISLEVEHVDDKHNNPARIEDWDNFLLACKNCNTIKGTKPINYNAMVFPHIHNTYKIIQYLTDGVIEVNTTFPNQIQIKIQNTINLVGLDRLPGHLDYSDKDKRWEYRMKVWRLANKYLQEFESNSIKIVTIIDLAVTNGFWGVWMQVFENHDEVLTELIQNFQETFVDCRTTNINRNPI